MTRIAIWLTALLAGCAQAQTGGTTYKIGATVVAEDETSITIRSTPPVRAEILPAGHVWPPVFLDEAGQMYAGASVVDTASAKASTAAAPGAAPIRYPHGLTVTPTADGFMFARGAARCLLKRQALGLAVNRSPADILKYRTLQIAASDKKVLALAAFIAPDQDEKRYQVGEIDVTACRFTSVTKLGNPDLLVELGWSPQGGWWIAGSIEQTLLRSADGRQWQTLPLSSSVMSIIGAYPVSKNEIWLSAAVNDADNQYFLAYSADGGKKWVAPRAYDPLLKKLPPAWLDGHRRVAEFNAQQASNPAAR